MNLFFDNLTKSSFQSNSVNQVADSNFGKSFYDLNIVYNQFNKVSPFFLADLFDFILSHLYL